MLVGEPFNVPLIAAWKLTPFQVTNIYFRPREEGGSLRLPEDLESPTPKSEKEMFQIWADFKKLKPWQVAKLWNIHVSKR